jgi:hypothetical protein
MNRTKSLLILAAGMLLGSLVFGRPASAPVSAQPAGAGVARWEYAELSSLSTGKTWSTPDKTLTVKSWEELLKKVGLKANAPFPALLTYFGGQGWELVSHTATSIVNGGLIQTSETWSFKRPLK